ncbi:MAG: serine acetyltransferase [Oscillospiraceae bacterium]|nr:serine acetyltransferase [Oscillospiraceae bacterium]
MDALISKLLSSHASGLDCETKRPEYLPDKDEVAEIVNLLRKLLFPGYFDKDGPPDAESGMRDILTEVEGRLRRQICRALNSEAEASADCAGMYDNAGAICSAFLAKLPALLEVLLTDVQAAYDGDPAARSKHEIIFAYPGVYAVSVYRLAHELHKLSVPLIPRMMTEHAHSVTGIDIHPGADIGSHFFIDHGTGVVIGETTQIGAYVKLYQGVTLGGLSTRGGQRLRGKKRHPTIEDEVTVYSGASILGGDTVIGKGSVVGGNVFITQSVPPYTKMSLKDNYTQTI